MTKKFLIHLSVFVLLSILVIPLYVRAFDTSGTINIINPFNCAGAGSGGKCTLIDFINAVLNKIVMPVAAVIAALYIIWAGFTYVTAQGNPGEIKKAHERLLWALVGTGILLGAAGISAVMKNTVESFLNK